MRRTPRDYLTTNHHLPHVVDRFVQKFPDADMMKVNVCPHASKVYEEKFSGIVPFSPGPIYVQIFRDPFVGMFEPDTILVDRYVPPGNYAPTQRFRIVQQTEWDEGLLPHHEIVSWTVDVRVSDFGKWCRDGRGIEIRPHRRGSGENLLTVKELVFNAPGSRTEFMMNWNIPKPS